MLSLSHFRRRCARRLVGRSTNGLTSAGTFSPGHFQSDDRYRIDWPGLGTFAFRPGSRDVLVWPEPDAPHEEISDTFDRLLQPVIVQALGKQALHAAAFAGPSGTDRGLRKRGFREIHSRVCDAAGWLSAAGRRCAGRATRTRSGERLSASVCPKAPTGLSAAFRLCRSNPIPSRSLPACRPRAFGNFSAATG